MGVLMWESEPTVDRPIMIVALEGHFDAAQAATSAVEHLKRFGTARRIAGIDPEEFYDFTEQRPVVSFDSDGTRQISWPENDLYEIETADGQPDVILLAGTEPHYRWKTFSDAVVEVAQRAGASLVVTIGAMVGLAPHTRALGVVGSATDLELGRRLGLSKPSYEGPTGLVGVLHDRLGRQSLPVISLRVSVPHYVPQPPNPEATRSLLSRLELVIGITTDHQSLEPAAAGWRDRIDQIVANDDEMASYVARLEDHVDLVADELLPSGDDLASELQAFLRDRGDSA